MQPTVGVVEGVLSRCVGSTAPSNAVLRKLLSLCFCCGIAVALSCMLADVLSQLETLMGCFFKSFNVFLIPCLGYARICQKELKGRPLRTLLVYSPAFFGAVWGVSGVGTSLQGMMG